MENSKPNVQIQLRDSTTGVLSTGKNAQIEKVTINQGDLGTSKQDDDLKEVIGKLREEIEKSQLPDFKKTDALNNLAGIEKELAKADQPQKQEGIQHFLQNLRKVVENIKPLGDLVGSLIKLLHPAL